MNVDSETVCLRLLIKGLIVPIRLCILSILVHLIRHFCFYKIPTSKQRLKLPNCYERCYGNDRRSRCVFLCFYSAIFQLTSAKFQTFAYNSRTVGSSYMKFWQQFEINELFVCSQFRGNRSRDFGFRIWKPPRKFGIKSGLSQKRLKYGKNIS